MQGFAAQPDGEALYWKAPGGEQGADPAPADGARADIFLARRTTEGWHSTWLTTDPADRPMTDVPSGLAGMDADGFVFISSDLLQPWPTKDPALYLGNGPTSSTLLSAAPGAAVQPGLDLNQWTTSQDLSSTAFATTASLDPADTDTSPDIYVWRGDTLALVSTRTDGTADNTAAEPFLSGAQSTREGFVADGGLYSFNQSQSGFPVSQGGTPVSADGRSIVVSTTASLDPEDTDTGADLYLWRAGQGLSLISDDERAEPGCPGVPGSTTDCTTLTPPDLSSVAFVGMSEDASIVYLRTREGLLDADTDGGVDIYRYRVAAPAGQRLSLATGPGTSSDVYPVSVSADGQLFFAATDRLGVDPPPGTGVVLYRWDGSEIATVSTLTDDDIFSLGGEMRLFGIASTEPVQRSVRATADGSALLFKTTGALDPKDTDTAADLYLWRAGGGLNFVSGDSTVPGVDGRQLRRSRWVKGPIYLACAGGRVISADASRVFFASRDALTTDAGDNGRAKLYEWQQGMGISLLSAAGEDAAAVDYVDNDVTGTSVFFLTGDSLVGADTDGGAIDTYDARIGGGFPDPPPPPDRCQGDACQGPVTQSLPAPTAGSVSFVADGNSPSARGKASVGVAATKAVSGAAARLKVRVPGAGRISVAGAGLEPSATSASKAGTYRVPLRLSPAAKKSLRQKKTLKVKARVSYRAKDGRTASKTVSITFTTTKKGH